MKSVFKPSPQTRELIVFALLNMLALLLIARRYSAVSSEHTKFSAQAFSYLMTVGHFSTLSLIAVLPSLALSSLRKIPAVIPWLLALALCWFLDVFVIIDSYAFQLFRFHLNAAVLGMLFGDASSEIFIFSDKMLYKSLLIVLALLITLLSFIWLARKIAAMQFQRGTSRGILTLICLSAITHNLFFAWADAVAYAPVTIQAQLYPLYPAFTARKFLKKLGISTDLGQQDIVITHTEGNLHYPLSPLICTTNPTRLNVIFIVIDALRFDVINEIATPQIKAFSSQTSKFTNHWSGGSATRTGIFSIFYGIPGTYWQAFLRHQQSPVLIDKFLEQGYQMAIFGSAPLSSPEFDRTVFAKIQNLRRRSSAKTPDQRDQEITRGFNNFLETRNPIEPFMGFLFYDSTHSFDFPEDSPQVFTPSITDVDYLDLNQDFDPLPLKNRYLNAVHFVDSEVGKVLNKLREKNLINNSIIFITGDHGEEFNDTKMNFWRHTGNFTKFQTQVPLLVAWPNQEIKEYPHWSSHYDIAPTLLSELFQCTNPPRDYAVGHNLFRPEKRKFMLVSNYGNSGIIEPDRLTTIFQFGGMHITDPLMQPLTEAVSRSDILQQTFEQQSRFYK
ncbi:DUF3413 domain-containing protein [bacterium]|nr:DUF3413 domain-containing protein [bacterium]